jgi:hypothetical protein
MLSAVKRMAPPDRSPPVAIRQNKPNNIKIPTTKALSPTIPLPIPAPAPRCAPYVCILSVAAQYKKSSLYNLVKHFVYNTLQSPVNQVTPDFGIGLFPIYTMGQEFSVAG